MEVQPKIKADLCILEVIKPGKKGIIQLIKRKKSMATIIISAYTKKPKVIDPKLTKAWLKKPIEKCSMILPIRNEIIRKI
jgi:hypothetical protein